MNHIPIYRRTPIHIVSRKHFPPLHGRVKEQFLKTAETIIIARDPFERLLSSYQVTTAFRVLVLLIPLLYRINWTWPIDQPWWRGTALVRCKGWSRPSIGRSPDQGTFQHLRSLSVTWWESCHRALWRWRRWREWLMSTGSQSISIALPAARGISITNHQLDSQIELSLISNEHFSSFFVCAF